MNTEKQVILCLQKPDGKCTFVMNLEALTSLLMSGWIPCHPQCKTVGEAVAWMEESSKTTKSSAEEMVTPLGEASSGKRG